jgi:hypothetical protein
MAVAVHIVYATARGPCGRMKIKESAVDVHVLQVLAPIALAILSILMSKRW